MAGPSAGAQSANKDGLGGRDTLESFQNAEFRLLTTGDSFTHRKQDGLTIPDVIAEQIADRTSLRTANLNFGRGTYGVLQMLSMAATQAVALSPDVVVIEFISDDLTRGVGGRASCPTVAASGLK